MTLTNQGNIPGIPNNINIKILGIPNPNLIPNTNVNRNSNTILGIPNIQSIPGIPQNIVGIPENLSLNNNSVPLPIPNLTSDSITNQISKPTSNSSKLNIKSSSPILQTFQTSTHQNSQTFQNSQTPTSQIPQTPQPFKISQTPQTPSNYANTPLNSSKFPTPNLPSIRSTSMSIINTPSLNSYNSNNSFNSNNTPSQNSINSQNSQIGNYSTRLSIRTTESKVKKGKKVVPVLYPIFETCSQLISDVFWVDLLIKSSQGKFKRGFTYKDGYLIYKNKDKLFLESDPIQVLNQYIYFFRNKAGIMSDNDKKMESKIIEQKMVEQNENQEFTWSDIKCSKIKDIFINEYIEKVSKYYNLNNEEKLQLKCTIYYGVILGSFNSENIEIVDRTITSIRGLNYDNDTRTFSIDSHCVPKKNNANKSKRKIKGSEPLQEGKYVSLSKKWCQFIKHLEKKVTGKNGESERMETERSSIFTTLHTPTVSSGD